MLEFKTNQGEIHKLSVCGSMDEIVADIHIMVNRIYNSLGERNSELFKKLMISCYSDEEFFKDIFIKDEDKDKIISNDESDEKELIEELEELIELLKGERDESK